MSFGKPSWIAAALMGEEAHRVTGAVSCTGIYPNTAGPYGGIGGAAISEFTITLLTLRGGDLLAFVDEKCVGWLPHLDADGNPQTAEVVEALADRNRPAFRVADMLPLDSCPHPVPSPSA